MRQITDRGAQIVRLLQYKTTLATNGSGFIPITSYDGNNITGCNDWSSFSSRYAQFRVRAVALEMFPTVTVAQCATSTYSVTPFPTFVTIAVVREGVNYANLAALLSGEEVETFGGGRIIRKSVNWDAVPDAKLWVPTNAVVPAANRYGFNLSGNDAAPAASLSTTYYHVIVKFVVEFATPQ